MVVGPRILFVADAYPQSLFSATPIGIVRALRKLGADVEVMFLSKDGRDTIPGLDRVHLLRCGLRSYRTSMVALLKLIGFLARHRSPYDVVIVEPNMAPALVPFAFLRRWGCRFPLMILDVRTQPVEVPDNLRGRMAEAKFDAALGIAIRFFDGMLVITEEMDLYVRERKGNHLLPVGVWTSGIHLEMFNPQIDQPAVEMFEDRFVILYHGQLSLTRGLDNVVLAVDEVRRQHPEILVFFVGSGAMRQPLEKLIAALGLQDHAAVRDPVPHAEIPRYIKSADIGILPFPDHIWWRTQSPIKLFEYLAMETPVIATDIPMNRSVIRWHQCAFMIPDNSPVRIAEGIKKALEARTELSAMGKEGRRLVEEEFTWDRQAERILTHLQGLGLRWEATRQPAEEGME